MGPMHMSKSIGSSDTHTVLLCPRIMQAQVGGRKKRAKLLNIA